MRAVVTGGAGKAGRAVVADLEVRGELGEFETLLSKPEGAATARLRARVFLARRHRDLN